jgi:hypothetical protein
VGRSCWPRRSCSSRWGVVVDRLPGMRPSSQPSDDQLDAAIWCRHLIPNRSVYAFLADHRHEPVPAAAVATWWSKAAATRRSRPRWSPPRCWCCRRWRACRTGRVHHPRLPHRQVSRHGQVPGGRHRAGQQRRPGQLRARVSLLPAASALHHRQAGPHHPPPPPRGRAARRPPPHDHSKLPAKLPAVRPMVKRSIAADSPDDHCECGAARANVRRCRAWLRRESPAHSSQDPRESAGSRSAFPFGAVVVSHRPATRSAGSSARSACSAPPRSCGSRGARRRRPARTPCGAS